MRIQSEKRGYTNSSFVNIPLRNNTLVLSYHGVISNFFLFLVK